MKDKLQEIYATLGGHYDVERWWPARSAYEVIAGAILTQNTNWNNVTRALANFGDRLTPACGTAIDLDELKQIIRPAGFYNQKARYLKHATAWFTRYNCDMAQVRRQPLAQLRQELLQLKGIGPETADSILLYAFDLPSFVIDAYTRRLCQRYPLPLGESYATLKAGFEKHLECSPQLYNRYHALIVTHAKAHCRKKPLCRGCPLEDTCRKLVSAS